MLDRGLGPALGILAGTSAIPVGLTVALTERPSPAIEAMAYFCAAELLANVTKHSGASRVTISVTRTRTPGWCMSVTDDGDGGARLVPAAGWPGCSSACRPSTGGSRSTARPAVLPSSPSNSRGTPDDRHP